MKARVKIKRGVILSYNVWWEHVEECLEEYFGDIGIKVLWLTSALEGNHSPSSSHYEGRAFDIRKLPGYTIQDQKNFATGFQAYLDKHAELIGFSHWKFFVMFHGRPKHFHIQVKRGVDP